MYKPDERFQLLHHAYVYGFNLVAHVVGGLSAQILSATVVNYDNSLLDAYGEVVATLKDEILNWAYTDIEAANIVIPNNIIQISKDIPTINGKEALYGTVKLWKHMYSDPTILPRSVLQRIIPISHAKWNANKGSSDTTTKLVDDCHVKPPRCYTNFEVVASMRSFSNLCATILHLFHVISAKKDILQAYPSLQHYRNAASHRCTYQKMLRMIYTYLKIKLDHHH